MRLTFIFSIFFTLLLSCSKKENTTFTGTIKGLSKGSIYLQQIKDSSLVTLDSVSLNGSNQFSFSFNIDEPDVFMLHLDKNDGTIFNDRLKLFLQPGEQILDAKLENFRESARIVGSSNHEKLQEYEAMMQKFNLDDFKLTQLNAYANKTGKQGFVDATIQDLNNSMKRKYLYTVNFAMNNKELEIAPYIAVTEISDANKKYLDTIYKSLPPKIQASKYGIQLEALTYEE